MAEQQPGSIITPGGQPSDPAPTPEKPKEATAPPASKPVQSTTQPPAPEAPQPTPAPAPEPPVPPAESPSPNLTPTQPQPQPTSQQPPAAPSAKPEAPQSFATSGFAAPQADQAGNTYDVPPANESLMHNSQQADSTQISWTASEYIAHQKSAAWYMALAIGTLLLLIPVYFITNGDIVSLIAIAFVVIVFAVYAGKKPRELEYSIHANGVTIGAKTYAYHQFKTFSVIDEGAFSSIVFLPMSRFMPAISLYYDPKDEEAIIGTLSNYLPMDTQKRDLVDNLMKKIRF